MRTEVAIVGAGPAGLLLAHLLAQDGIDSVVLETRSEEYVAARIRAGVLEHSTVDLLGRSVWIYGQTEVQKDLVAARTAAGQRVHYEVQDTALHDLDTDHPSVTFTDASGVEQRVRADVVAGCDGSFGPSRAAVPERLHRTWERVYPYSWLGVLADGPPSTAELIYAWHPDGFALHSMRSDTVSRLYLQVPPDTDIADWSDERIWEQL